MSESRRSTRNSAKSSTQAPIVDSNPSETNEEMDLDDGDQYSNDGNIGEDELPPVRTRKRKAVGGVGGVTRTRKKGKLSSVLTLMPNEVIGEICSHLQPSDLLHLVQSSKIFAIFLLAKSSASIWRYARLSVQDLPSCPADITEQQYACLLFGHYCQGCGKTGSRASAISLAWQIRRRWCESCRSHAGHKNDELYLRIDSLPSIDRMRSLVPKSYMNGTNRVVRYSTICRRSQFDAVSQRLKALEGDDTAQKAFFESQKALVGLERSQASSATAWILARADERDAELDVVRVERIEDLKNHLEHQGYARDLLDGIDLWTYRDMPSMGQSKRLTSRIWAKQQSKILPYVEAALESLRSDIKRTSYSCAAHAINEECISRLPSIDYLPIDMYSSFSCWPNKLQSLLDEWALGEAFDAFLQSRKAKSPPPDLPSTIRAVTSELITQCSQRVRDHFTNLVQLQTNLPPLLLPLEILNLAIVVFRTPGQNWMKRGVPYYALRHSGSFYNENGEISVEYLESQWSFDNTGSSIMHQMVILHGMDPSTCTHYELDGVAEYVLCEVCGDMAMHWEAANRHWGRFHQGEDAENSLWRCLDEAEKAIFHPIWTRMQIFGPQDCCALCSAKCPRGLEFMEHILSEHSDILGDNPNTAQYRQPLRRWLYESAIQWPLSAQDP